MWKEPRPHRLHQEQALRTRDGYQLLCLGGIHRECLLDEHRLAGTQREECIGMVHGVRSRDVHDVDVRIRHQFLVARVPVGNVELLGESIRRIDVARPDGRGPAGVGERQVGSEAVGDSARSDQSPAKRFAHRVSEDNRANPIRVRGGFGSTASLTARREARVRRSPCRSGATRDCLRPRLRGTSRRPAQRAAARSRTRRVPRRR